MNKLGQLTITEACIDDAPILLALMQAAFEEYEGVLMPPSGAHDETADTVRARLTAGAAALARVGEDAAGFAFYEPAGDLVYLGRLSVLPRFRNHGIGGALVVYVERRAKEQGAAGVRLGVRLQLPHLVVRYERLGYRITRYKTHRGYDQPTWVYMEKRWA
jgi:GNAT superfamily N-acetyltransferase